RGRFGGAQCRRLLHHRRVLGRQPGRGRRRGSVRRRDAVQPDDPAVTVSAPRDTHRQSGLTLVEILVALSIGLFIIGAIIAMFISSSQVCRSQDALTRIQENGRFAVEVIARDIRAAALLGCQSYLLPEVPRSNGVLAPGRIRNTLKPDPPAAPAGSFDFSTMVQAYDAVPVAEDADPTRRRLPPVDPAGEAAADAASWTPALPAPILPAG